MTVPVLTRRAFAVRLAALPLGLTAGARALGAERLAGVAPTDDDGLTHTSEAIHQEIRFDASRRRVYDALTVGKQFDAVTRLSDGAQLLAAPGAKPTAISDLPGGAFVLFGGYITGRHSRAAPWRAPGAGVARGQLEARRAFDCELCAGRRGREDQSRVRPSRVSGRCGVAPGVGMACPLLGAAREIPCGVTARPHQARDGFSIGRP